MDRYKALLDDYYGVAGAGSKSSLHAGGEVGIDSPSFSSADYVGELLGEKSFVQVLETDEALVQEIRNLDSDMQLLVYDNYSKFIAATDTIRNMKHKVDEIEVELQSLKAQMGRIGATALHLNAAFSKQRGKIEKLLRLQGLVSNLNFLFELPLRLSQCIREGQRETAVYYYQTATPFLDKYSSVASFSAISRESAEIIEALKSQLLSELDSALTGTSSHDRDSFAALIRTLQSVLPDRDFSLDFLQVQDRLLRDQLQSCTGSFSDQLQSSTGSSSLSAFVEYAFREVLQNLTDVSSVYLSLFLQEELPDDLMRTRLMTRLADFAKPLVHDFFSLLRDTFTAASPFSYAERLEALNILLTLLGTVEAPAEILRPGSLVDRGLEVVEVVTRRRVVLMFEEMKKSVVEDVLRAKKSIGKEKVKDIAKEVPRIARELAEKIASGCETAVRELEEVLAAGEEMLSELSSIFTNLVAFQQRSFSKWLCMLFMALMDPQWKRPKDVVRMKEEDIMGEDHPLVEGLDEEVDAAEPFFILCLAFVAQELEASTDPSGALPHVPQFGAAKKALTLGVVESLSRRHVGVFMAGFSEERESLLTSAKPQGVHPFVEELVGELLREFHALCKACGDERAAAALEQQVTEARQFRVNTLQNRHSVAKEAVTGGGLTMDIERMFESRMLILSEVDLRAKEIFAEVLKLLLKAIFESVRCEDYSPGGFQQMEIDISYVELCLMIAVEDVAETKLTTYFSQILKAIAHQSLNPSSLPTAEIDSLCRLSVDKLTLELNTNS